MRIGFIVNPIAGMGGRVGLKGTDNVLEKAIQLGAKPVAPRRAIEFLREMKTLEQGPTVDIITCPGEMGEDEAKTVTFTITVLPMPRKSRTTAEDTRIAVKHMIDQKVDLIVFVGGDGTARDIFDALQNTEMVPVLGVPSGVKMYSGIFAVDPLEAAEVVKAFGQGASQLMDLEIVDADEDAIRRDHFSVRLYGVLKGPFVPMRLQGSKQISPETLDERENQMAVARFVVENIDPNGTYILGPGTTVKCIADLLGVEKTLLGVDVYSDKNVAKDVNEKAILRKIRDSGSTWIIISPIGRQGMLFGRGNQQISPKIIKKVGKERIVVAATKNKLKGIEAGILRVDTGDLQADNLLRGYIKVVTDYKEWMVMRVE